MKYKTFFLTLFIGVTTSHAADLGEINVTANRMQSESSISSKSVTVIDRETIEASRAQYVVDLLKGQSGLIIRDTSGIGSKAKVDLGGFGETSQSNVVVLIDGRRVNSPDMSAVDWTQIAVDQIERIEIVHGASSVLYGDGAVGGVINIITRIPESGGSISLGGGSFATSEAAIRIGANSGSARVEMNASGYKTDGYRDNSVFERTDVGARAEVDISERISLRLSGNYHGDRAGLPGALTKAQVDANPRQTTKPTDVARTTDGFVDAGVNFSSDSGVELDVAGGFRKRDTQAMFGTFASDSTLRTSSLRPKILYTGRIDSVSTKLVVGSDLEWSRGKVSGFDYTRKRDGIYAQGNLGFAENRINLSGGYRSERLDDAFGASGSDRISNQLNAWEIGLSADVTKSLLLKANYSSSMRFPALDERYVTWPSASINTALLPQTGRHFGGSIIYFMDILQFELAFSRADINREIFYNPATFANENYSSPTRHDVIRANVNFSASDLLIIDINYTNTKAKFISGNYNGKFIPAVPVNAFGASWSASWLQDLNTILKLTYVGSSFFISDQANVNPQLSSYTLLDVVANYSYDKADMFIRIDNLTGVKYSTYGAYTSIYPAATMQMRAGVNYRF